MAAGVVEKRQTINDGGKFGRTVYRLTHEVAITDYPFTKNEDTDLSTTEDKEAIKNSIKKEQYIKNNMNYQLIADMYNEICVSFPRLTKLSDARKKAIKARLKQYSVEDFKRLFTMAEESSFLKGGNNRNWMASFDWLITDANMAKTLDGNYSDRQKGKGGAADGTQSGSSFKL